MAQWKTACVANVVKESDTQVVGRGFKSCSDH